MNTTTLLKQLQELTENPKSVSAEKLQALTRASLEFFDQMQKQIHSKNPQEQAAAKEVLADLKNALEEQAQTLCKSLGVDPSQFNQLAEEPGALSSEEAEMVYSAQKAFDLRKEQAQAPHRAVKRSQRLIFS